MEISQKQKQEIKKIGQRYNLTLILAFGSQISGFANQKSDLDIAVLDFQPESYKRFGELSSNFSDIFKNYNIDLRFIKGAEPVFLYQVFKNCQLLYGEPQLYYHYKAFAYKNYVDSKSLFKLKENILLKNQKELEQIIN